MTEGPFDPMSAARRLSDPQAAGLLVALGQYEEEFNTEYGEDGWDAPVWLMLLYRALPPTELADEIDREMHGVLMLMAIKKFNLTEFGDVNTDTGPPVHLFLNWFADQLERNKQKGMDAMTGDLLDGAADVIGWGLHLEGWGVAVAPDEEEPSGPFKDHPDAIESRMIMAVDQAGFRYLVQRYRKDNQVIGACDVDVDSTFRAGGRVMDALERLVAVTPLPNPT